MNKILSLIFSFALFSFVGCASSQTQKPTVIAESQQIKKTIIEKVPNINPDWIAKGDFIKDGKQFVLGFSEGFSSLQASRISAGNSARMRFSQLIKDKFKSSTLDSLKARYGEEVGGIVEATFYSATDNITVDGIMFEEYYSEQIQEQSGSNNKVYWRSYCLASTPQAKYKEAVERAYNETAKQIKKEQKIKNDEAEELGKELKKRFYEE